MKFEIKLVSKFVALAILAGSASSVLAQSAGDYVVSAGWAHIGPRDSSTPLQIETPAIVAGPVAGSGATVAKTDTLGFSVTRFFTDNWAGSLDLGLPPTYKLSGTGTFANLGQIGTAKQLAPAALAKYYFGSSQSALRPVVGLGVTHVSYSNIELSDSFQNYAKTSGFSATAHSTAELSKAWAPVYNVGASYAFTKDWSAMLSVSYVPLKTTADITTTNTALGTATSKTSLTLNPVVTYISVGYRF